MSFSCTYCNSIYATKQRYDKHILTQKHEVNRQLSEKKYACIPCSVSISSQYNYERHLKTKKHISNDTHICIICAKTYKSPIELLNHNQICKVEQVKQDPNLIKYVMEQMAKQNETITTLVAKVGNTTINNIDNSVNNSHNKQFNLQFFLNEQCKDAINWTDFIQNIKVSLEDIDVQSNITDKVIGTICKELDTLGLYKRPIHCTDVKRHKSCIKDNNEWKKDPALLEKGIKLVSGKYQKVINDDCLSTPKWFEDQELTEKIMDRMNVYMKEPEEKCMAEILKHAVIKEVL
jgi:hypothetical protein